MAGGWFVLLGAGCAAAPAARAPAPVGFTKPVSFALLEDYDKGDDLRQVARDFEAMRRLGVRTWRGSFGWDDYEPAPGRYDFAWLQEFAALAHRYGIELRPYLGYTPEWAGAGGTDEHAWNDPPKDPAAWHAFVLALATALRDAPNVRSYEIYNEENVPLWWEGTVEQYAATVARGADAIRAADPDAEVLIGGLVYPDADWIEGTCEAHDNAARVDVVPFHAYPETWTPDSVVVENYLDAGYRQFLRTVVESCGRKPVWINETGFATVPGRTEADQANWWARAIATFLADSAVTHIGIYEIKDLREDRPVIGDAPNYHLGLLRRDRTPKLAFHTVRRLVELLGTDSITVADGALDVRVTAGRAERLHHHLFVRPDGIQVLLVWDRSGAPTLRLTPGRGGAEAIEYRLDGSAVPYGAFDGRTLDDVRIDPGTVRIFAVRPRPGRP